jgi:chemotaxis protein methyltransferase CheR
MAEKNMQTEQAIPRSNSDAREFDFTKGDFERVCKLIYDHAGISLSDGKQELVYSRLSRRLRETGVSTFGQYLNLLEQNDAKEWGAFVNALTTNLTSFFREPHHFPILAELLKKLDRSRTIVLWCSASSTGEEPYSMAMTAVDAFNSFTPPVKIIATDLDTNVLDAARRGEYSMDRVEKLDKDLVKRFFLRGSGAQDGAAGDRQARRDGVHRRLPRAGLRRAQCDPSPTFPQPLPFPDRRVRAVPEIPRPSDGAARTRAGFQSARCCKASIPSL